MENNQTTTHWIFLALAIWSLIVVMVPFRYFKKVWLPSFITGFLMTYLINYLAVGILKMWSFSPTILTLAKTPFFVAVAWFGAILIFNYLVLVYSRFKIHLILLFATLSTIIFIDASTEGHLKLHQWSIAETIFLALVTHCLSLIVLRLFTKENDLAPNQKPLG